MTDKIFSNRKFLITLAQNPALVFSASDEQIALLIEILHNISKIALTSQEKKKIAKLVPLVKRLGRIRKINRARDQLIQHGGSLLPLIIPAALSLLLS